MTNMERARAYGRAYHAAHRAERNARCRAYALANPEKTRARKAAYHLANREKIRAHAAAYRAAHPKTLEQRESIKAKRAIRYAANRERLIAQSAEYHRAHPEKAKAHKIGRFGITLAQYNQMLSDQRGVCAICGEEETVHSNARQGRKKSLAVDHDHQTGRVRGLLCSRCNTGIGWFRETPELLTRAAAYLSATRELRLLA